MYQNETYYHTCETSSSVTVPVNFVPGKEAWNLESILREGFEVKLKINERPCKKCIKSGGFCSFDKYGAQFCSREDFSFYPNKIKEFSGALLGIKCSKVSPSDHGAVPSLPGTAPGSFEFDLTGSRG